MITMIGVRHVVSISEQVSFIVKHTWPDAVLVELDERRYASLMNGKREDKVPDNTRKHRRGLLGDISAHQNKASEKNDAGGADEMLAAIYAGKTAGADIICIDKDAEQVMKEIEENMSFSERMRFSFSLKTDELFGKSKKKITRKRFIVDEESYVQNMRKKFPTIVEKLVDERNAFMAEKIRTSSEKYKNMVVVVGDVHVKGICDILDGIEIDTIRLAEMMDPESMDNIRSRIWNRRAEASE
ncbi:TraB family protein [Candidatus Methanoplasma termitum]|uniref:TraB family protein n=1 Tax=Candidatus Methanoplasma termitum TaxID=1577791 RepID=A0A0A7LEF7_9ARCH|nr:TraB/GumN family protein [Candidatus Methanoplasma termitum]AIZ55916.1 TraB family protein [Candidatus Methanoplasma termitum]MCL2334234.1 TraB/GumN family protein [Candidatus Methanoplasma sp.]